MALTLLRMSLFLVLMLFSLAADAQDCPEGFKCIPDEQAAELATALKHHNCMIEEANDGRIDLDWEPNQITVTEDGQVFVKEELVGSLKWCDWDLELHGKTDVLVYRQEEPADIGFALRVKLGLMWLPTYIGKEDLSLKQMFDPAILFEPFHVWQFHAQIHGGLESFGLTLGMDLTKNLDVFVGVGLTYREATVVPVLGLSLSFN